MKGLSSRGRSNRQARRYRALRMEFLEQRALLNGDVRAFVRGGDLRIFESGRNGAGQHDNEITIEQSAPNSFTISSRDGTTTINGQTGPLTFNNVKRNVLITMDRGNDVVELLGDSSAPLVVRDRLFMDMGSGADQVLMSNVRVKGLHINTGGQQDLINIGDDGAAAGVVVALETVIVTGNSGDDLRIANSNFRRAAVVDMGTGNDTTTIQGTTTQRTSVIFGNSGRDTLNRENNSGKFKYISYEIVNNSVNNPAPIAPVAAGDAATVLRGSTTSINVATNDTAAPGKTINQASITITQNPAFGTATANANGTVTYVNNGNAATSDTFKYTIKDSAGVTSNVATVTITVNAALAAVNDSANVTEDTGPNPVIGNVLTNDTGGIGNKTVTQVNGSAANVGAAVNGANGFGSFTINANGAFTYQLNNSNATVNALNDGSTPLTDTITYQASAGTQTSTATLTITITGRTDLAAVADPAAVTEDTGPNPLTGNVTTNDTRTAGATLTVTQVNGSADNVGDPIAGANGFGTFNISSTGAFTYQLNNSNATVNALNDGSTPLTDTITYQVSDGTQTSTATVTVTITGRTDLAAVADPASVAEDTGPNPVTGNVTTNDTRTTGATLTVTQVNGSADNVGDPIAGANGFGTFTINSNGTFTYQLNNGNATVNALNDGSTPLTDTITYQVSDGTQTSTATVTVTITGRTDLAAVNDPASITEDASPNTVNGNVTTNDTQAANTTLTVTQVKGVAGNVGTAVAGTGGFGLFTINSNGTYTYQLDNTNSEINGLPAGQIRTDAIQYTVTDGTQTSTATLTVTITGVDELAAVDDPADITEDAATPNTITGNVITNDTGGQSTKSVTAVDGNAASVNTDVPGDFGTFRINANGTFTYTLDDTNPTVNALDDASTPLTDSIDYTVTSGLSTDIGTLIVTIHGNTDTP